MKQRIIVIAALVVLLGAAGLILVPRLTAPRLTDEQQLYQQVARAERAANDRNAAGLTRLLSDDYKDAAGYDKHHLTGLIVSGLRSVEQLQVVPTIVSLQVHGDTADMRLTIRYFSGPSDAQGVDFPLALRWRKEGRQWKVTSAEGYSAGPWEGS